MTIKKTGARVPSLGKLGCAALVLILAGPAAASVPDLPPCERVGTTTLAVPVLGIVQPHADAELLNYAGTLASTGKVSVCEESWSSVLPAVVPWAKTLERGYGFAFLLVGVLLAVALLHALTPRRWWERTTLVGVASVLGLGYVLGTGGLAVFHALGGQRLVYDTVVSLQRDTDAAPVWFDMAGARALRQELLTRGIALAEGAEPGAASAAPPASPVASAVAPGKFRVFHRLNLRAGPAVAAERLALLAIGVEVSFSGVRDGDWWQVRTADGAEGWVSSLWLRRIEEVGASAGNA